MAGNVQVEGGAYQDLEGNPLALGYLIVQLNHDSQYSGTPAQVVAGLKERIALDANGNIPSSPATYLYSSDVLAPPDSYYIVQAYKSDGTSASASEQYWQFTSTPDPLNVGSLVPYNPPGPGLPPGGEITLETNGVVNSNQQLLNLVSGSGITLSNVSGNTTISSTGGSGTVSHTGSLSQTLTASTLSSTHAPSTYPIGYTAAPLPTSSLPAATVLVAPAVGSVAAISSYTITSNVITCAYTSTYPIVYAQKLLISGFSSSTFLNNQVFTVALAGLSSTQFEAPFVHANASATENGTANTSSTGASSSFSSWFIDSNQFWGLGVNSPPFIGSTVLLQGSAHASYLNGTTGVVSYQGFAVPVTFVHADQYGLYDSGIAYTAGGLTVVVTGWAIVADILYLFFTSSSSAQLSATVTLEGFTAGAAILNGQTVTLPSSGSFFAIMPYTAANDSATETLDFCEILDCSSATMGRPSASTLTTLGLVETFSATAVLGQTSSGRFWVGLGDARNLATGLIGTNQTPETDARSELCTDAPSYSFVGFRYSKGAGDTHWQCVCNNGGTQTTTSSGVAADTNPHVFSYTNAGSSIVFAIDGTSVATISTNLPSTSLVLTSAASIDNLDNCGNTLFANVYKIGWTTSA